MKVIRSKEDYTYPLMGHPIAQRYAVELMCTKAAAERLGISYQTLEKWRSQNRGPRFVKLENKTVRYRQADLDAFIQKGDA